jgi:hypothetical protein
LRHLLAKLGLADRVQIVVFADESGSGEAWNELARRLGKPDDPRIRSGSGVSVR